MPYITQEARQEMVSRPPETVGELTYWLYKRCLKAGEILLFSKQCHDICVHYLRSEDESFSRHAEVLGALTAASLELSRQHPELAEERQVLEAVTRIYYPKFVVPYEDRKIEENGDVEP